jgi:hypothetical protein
MNLQKDAGIKPTGLLDSLTTNLFQTPRCALKDIKWIFSKSC